MQAVVTEARSAEKRKTALEKLRLITDRIMLRRVKRDHTSSMELPPKRYVYIYFCFFSVSIADPSVVAGFNCTMNSSVKSNGISPPAS